MGTEKDMGTVLGSNIQYYLAVNHMSRKELADRIGVSTAAVGFWCIGDKIPRMDKVDKMCAVFGCSREDLLIERESYDASRQAERIMAYARKLYALPENIREEVMRFIDFRTNQEDDS